MGHLENHLEVIPLHAGAESGEFRDPTAPPRLAPRNT
jgi:hypothetical protein